MYGHPLAGSLRERQFEKVQLENGWEKVPNCESMFVHRQGICLSVYVDITLAGKKQNLDPMWKKLMKHVDLGEPTSFLHHVYLRGTQRECQPNEGMVDEYRKFSNRESLQEQLKRCLNRRKRVQTLLRGPTTLKDMRRNALNGTANWRAKQSRNCTRSPQHILTTISSKKEEMETVGEVSEVCSHIVLKCPYFARIGRPDIPWSANKLARAVTKWTRACDRRLACLISYIHNTSDHRQYCHVGNTAQHCRLGLFQDSDFAGDLEDSKSTSGYSLYLRDECSFPYVGCARNKLQFHARTVFPLVISGIWLSKYCMFLQFNPEHGATCCVMNTVKTFHCLDKC